MTVLTILDKIKMRNIEQKRSIIFLGLTLLIGALLIGGMLLFETETPGGEGSPRPGPGGGVKFKEMETKINSLTNQKFDPSCYSTLKTEIDTNYELGIFPSSSKTYLTTKLNSVYSDLVYKRCEIFLKKDIGIYKDLTGWLLQLEIIISKNAKIDYYKNQIKAFDYYSRSLSKEVDFFCKQPFDENRYPELKNIVNDMPKLDIKYKNSTKLYSIKTQNIKKLEAAYRNWAEQDNDLN
jgi:hypothetical protein